MKNNILKILQCYFAAILIFNSNNLYTQTPDIEWQNTIGGNYLEISFGGIIQTYDGGFIMAGSSSSPVSCDKTEPSKGGLDYWVVKTDQFGNVEWDKTIGGEDDEFFSNISLTADSGYILTGRSFSDISGDKSENNLGINDYWIVKLNRNGDLEWENTIGGSETEAGSYIEQTNDGGYIFVGNSLSGISGDKTEANLGSFDFWVIKLDNYGNILWQNTIGGNNLEDQCVIHQISDEGFILGGRSISNNTADKAEDTIGGFDIWLLKLDNSGNILWQQTIGGGLTEWFSSIDETSDGGFILGSWTNSGIGFDKTEAAIGSFDYWILKLNNIGIIEWQKTIGSFGFDELHTIIPLNDEGYLLGGISTSDASGDKSENAIGHIGTYSDFWIVRVDNNGNILWENTIGGPKEDNIISIQQTNDLGDILGGTSSSNNRGDKTEAICGVADFWIVKLFTEGVCNLPDQYYSDVQPFAAKVYWETVTPALQYLVRYRPTGTAVWNYKSCSADKHFVVLNELNCNTEYEWQLRSICAADGSSHSEFSSSHYFTTGTCRTGNDIINDNVYVYPNPVIDELNISIFGISGATSIQIFNLSGQIVFESTIFVNESFQTTWNTEHMPDGMYQLQIMINDYKYLEKIVVLK